MGGRIRSCVALILAVVVLLPAAPAAQTSSDFFNSDVVQRSSCGCIPADWEKLKQNFRLERVLPGRRGVERHHGTQRRHPVARPRLAQAAPSRACASTSIATPPEDVSRLEVVRARQPRAGSVGVHETVAMSFFARMNIPAPREAHARLYVNGEYAGLYAARRVDRQDHSSHESSVRSTTTPRTTVSLRVQLHRIPGGSTISAPTSRPTRRASSPKTHESENDEQLYRRDRGSRAAGQRAAVRSLSVGSRSKARSSLPHALRRGAEFCRGERRVPRLRRDEQLLLLSEGELGPARVHRLGRRQRVLGTGVRA